MKSPALLVIGCLLCPLFVLSGCTIGYQANSPEVKYSSQSSKARALQVPPDLTDVGNAEQFIVPGTNRGALTRNTLLPVFDGITFQRSGAAAWLQIEASPEAVWPKLLEFLQREQIPVAITQPLTGLIATRWQTNAFAPAGSALKNLMGSSRGKQVQRIAFRLERSGQGSRVFARSQTAAKAPADEAGNELVWPSASNDPEQTNVLLQQLLAFLGLEEQRVKGILGSDAAAALLDPATLVAANAGVELQLHQSYEVSFARLQKALRVMGVKVRSQNQRTGIIRVEDTGSSALPEYLLTVLPIHSSAVRVSVTGSTGTRLDPSVATAVLGRLRAKLV